MFDAARHLFRTLRLIRQLCSHVIKEAGLTPKLGIFVEIDISLTRRVQILQFYVNINEIVPSGGISSTTNFKVNMIVNKFIRDEDINVKSCTL